MLENSSVDFTVSETKWKVLELYGAIEFPPVLVCQSLIEAYFGHCWTWMPVVDPSLRDHGGNNAPYQPYFQQARVTLTNERDDA